MAKQKEEKQQTGLSALYSTKRQFVLTIGDDGAVLIYMNGNVLEQRLFITLNSKSDIKKMLALLQTDTSAPLSILMDIIDQSYTQQALPAVSILNIGKLVKRKLEREYPGDYLKGAIRCGRATGARKDWNYIFVACPTVSPLSYWLELVIDLPNQLRGIYLLPVEQGQLVDTIRGLLYKKKAIKESFAFIKKFRKHKQEPVGQKAEARWQIIITHDKVGGFRQVAYKDGHILFSRLIHSSAETSAEVIAGNIEQEFLNSLEYLRRLSFQEMDGYDITIVTSQEIKQALSMNVLKGNNILLYTPYEIAVQLDIPTAASEGDRFADVVIAAYFAQNKKRILPLHTPESRKLWLLSNLISWISKGMLFMLPVLMLVLLIVGFEIYRVQENINDLSEQKASIVTKWGSMERVGNYSIQETVKISDIVKLYKLLSGNGYSPLPIIADFNVAKGTDALVKNIDWHLNETGVVGSDGKPKATISVVFQVDFINKSSGFEGLFENFDLFIKRIETKFSHYNVEYSRLPEKITFDDKNKTIPISVTITGPKDLVEKTQ